MHDDRDTNNRQWRVYRYIAPEGEVYTYALRSEASVVTSLSPLMWVETKNGEAKGALWK